MTDREPAGGATATAVDAAQSNAPDVATTTGTKTTAAPQGIVGPRRWMIAVLGLLAAISAGVLVAPVVVGAFRPHLYAGTVLQTDTPAPSLADLSYANGEPVDLETYRGKVVLLYFGYSSCPDICPATLSTAATAIGELDDPDVPLLMISVDPQRDDPAALEAYVKYFAPTFHGVTGSTADIDRVASGYGVFYDLGDESDTDEYLVDHTATLIGVGPDGVLRIVWAPDVTASALSDDIEELSSR